MKTGRNHIKGRAVSILLRRSPWSVLLLNVIVKILLTGSFICPAFIVFQSCSAGEIPEAGTSPETQESSKSDSTEITICLSAGRPDLVIKKTGVFLYDSDGLRGMVNMREENDPGAFIKINSTAGEKDLVVIANSPRRLDPDAVSRYDTMELVAYDFGEDDPNVPISSGRLHLFIGRDSCICVTLHPLMSEVVVFKVTNEMEGYVLMESPRARLRSRNAGCEILKDSGFIPAETVPDSEAVPLPCDIGKQPQYPELALHCYPNDSSGGSIGSLRTGIELECEISGKTCSFAGELPSIERGSVIYAELTVRSPEDCSWEFNVSRNARDRASM